MFRLSIDPIEISIGGSKVALARLQPLWMLEFSRSEVRGQRPCDTVAQVVPTSVSTHVGEGKHRKRIDF